MPAPANPPFEAGALTQPRQLQRWLDCNKVNKLTRAETYITIPAFDVTADYYGYSDIVAVFNYEAPNKFSLKSFTSPENPSYIACIAWLDENGNLQRKKLINTDSYGLFFHISNYNGERISRNFRIEIWSYLTQRDGFRLNGADAVVANSLYSYISPTYWLGMFGTEIELVGSTWELRDTGLHTVLYTIAVEQFPFGVWQPALGSVPPVASESERMQQASAITIYTSKKQSYDYRFATDTTLATPSAVVTDFDSTLDLPFTFPTNSVPAEN